MKKIFLSLAFLGLFSGELLANGVASEGVMLSQEQYLALLKGEAPTSALPTVNVNNTINMDEVPANIKVGVDPNKEGYFLEGVQLGVGLSALSGAGAHIGYRIPYRYYNFWKNRFGFRVEYNDLTLLNSLASDYLEKNPVELGDAVLDSDIAGKSYGALVDFYPFGGTWGLGNIRLTAGYYTGDFSMGVNQSYSNDSSFTVAGHTYTIDGAANLAAKLDIDLTGPYLGAGFDLSVFGLFNMYFDAGLVAINTPVVLADITGTGTITGYNPSTSQDETVNLSDLSSSSVVDELLANVSSEYLDELENVGNYFPIVKAGIFLRF